MRRRTLALSLAVAAALIAPLPGCGGNDSPSNPTPVPTPTPAPQRTLVVEGSQSDLPPASTGAFFAQVIQVTGTGTATLEATVNWTFPSNPVAIAWAQGNCLEDPNCPFLVQNTTTAKPKTITASNLAPGTYSLVVLNFGTTNESISFQVFAIR